MIGRKERKGKGREEEGEGQAKENENPPTRLWWEKLPAAVLRKLVKHL